MHPGRYAMLRKGGLEPSLFPFLSIFLCVIGVLSFLNLVNSAIAPSKVVLAGDVEEGYKTAYQILCLPEGMLVIPSLKGLTELVRASGPQGGKVAEIIKHRKERRAELVGTLDDLSVIAEDVESESVLAVLQEIDFINRQSQQSGIQHQEFILFGIYPGGGAVYHQIHNLLLENPKLGINFGMEPMDPDWQLSLEEKL